MPGLPAIYHTAISSMIEASGAIMRVYGSDVEVVMKEDESPVTKADLESSIIIQSHLEQTGIPSISEEQDVVEYEERASWKENWLVDPLDGTRMFLKQNGEFSINISHVIDGQPIVGIIASPTTEEILFGGKEYGVYKFNFKHAEQPENWIEIQPAPHVGNPLTVICSRSYLHGSGFNYMKQLEKKYGELNYFKKGSALKFFDLAMGSADLYTRFAPTMEWDIAAGQAIIEALGGEVVDVATNKPLQYNKESLYNPHFIAKSKAFLSQ